MAWTDGETVKEFGVPDRPHLAFPVAANTVQSATTATAALLIVDTGFVILLTISSPWSRLRLSSPRELEFAASARLLQAKSYETQEISLFFVKLRACGESKLGLR